MNPSVKIFNEFFWVGTNLKFAFFGDYFGKLLDMCLSQKARINLITSHVLFSGTTITQGISPIL